MKPYRIFFLSIFLFLLGCGKKDIFKDIESGPINHHLIAVTKSANLITARGFSKATPKHTKIFFSVDENSATHISNDDGSFYFTLKIDDSKKNKGEFTFIKNEDIYHSIYNLKGAPKHLRNIPKLPLKGLDKELSGITISNDRLAISSYRASTITFFNLDKYWGMGEELQTVLLRGKNLGPRKITSIKNYTLATLYDANELALINNETLKVKRTKLKDKNGNLFVFTLNEPLFVKTPIDANGDNIKSKKITQSFAHKPEFIKKIDSSRFLVTFSNYYQYADQKKGHKAVIGPGIVALVKIKNEDLLTESIKMLNCKNPTTIVKKNENNFYITCSGIWNNDEGNILKAKNAKILSIELHKNTNEMTVNHEIILDDFSPAGLSLYEELLIIPKSGQNEIALVKPNTKKVESKNIHVLKNYPNMKFVNATHWYDDIIFLLDTAGYLVAFSPLDGYLPYPFNEPIRINKYQEKSIPLAPDDILFRHKIQGYKLSAKYKKGYSAFIKSEVQQSLIPLDFMEIFGP